MANEQKWFVGANDKGWHIIEVYSGRKKFIGPISGTGKNYHDEAVQLSRERNTKAGNPGYVFVPLLEPILNEPDQAMRRMMLMKYTDIALNTWS